MAARGDDAGVGRPQPLDAPGGVATRVSVGDADAAERLRHLLGGLTATFPPARRRLCCFVCIGTDRSTGDALGPLVGSGLVQRGVPAERVLGTLGEPVHATNLADGLRARGLLREAADTCVPLVVAVDACLGRAENVGTVSAGLGALRPGAGVNKDLPAVGDLFVTGTVNVGGFMEYFVLQNTRLHLVVRMATLITEALVAATGAT